MELLEAYFGMHRKAMFKDWHEQIKKQGLNGTSTIQLHHLQVKKNDEPIRLEYTLTSMQPEEHYFQHFRNLMLTGMGVPREFVMGDLHHGTN